MTITYQVSVRRTEPGRGEFLSRLFGVFGEQAVQHWCRQSQTLYENLGRPTLREAGKSKPWCTLDFTLRRRDTSQAFVAEMKCELQYQGYRFLRLTNITQLEHHTEAPSPAFRWFLRLARNPEAFDVRVMNKQVAIDGAILIWGAVTPKGREAVMAEHNIADVLSVEDMVSDLRKWQPAEWMELVGRRRHWCNELFDFLV
jgi:hypothetical protein